MAIEDLNKHKTVKLDRIDCKILNILQENNLLTNVEIAGKVGLSPPPCLRRIKRLRQLGVITQDVSLVDPFKVGQRLVVFVNINLEKQRDDLLHDFEKKMLKHPEVMQCYFVSGDVDYFLVLHFRDTQHYHEFSRRVFANEPNIKSYRTGLCLNRVKYNTKITIPV